MIKPLNNNVLIEQVTEEVQSTSGILLAGNSITNRAKVLAVGPKVQDVSIGDIIIPDWIKVKKTGTYSMVSEDDILMVLE